MVGLHVLAGILLFVVTPGELMDWDYSGKILLGVGLALAIGEWLIRASSRQQAQQALALQGR